MVRDTFLSYKGKYCLRSLISNTLIANTIKTVTSGLTRPGVVVFLGLLFILLLPTASFAHGGANVENDKCSFRAEGHMMHFTAYQPSESNREELCKEIPTTAETIFVLDIIDEMLRTVPIKIDIEKKVSEEYVSFLSIPAKAYETGSVFFDLTDVEAGDYRILASLEAAEAHMHTEEQKHRPGFMEFSIRVKDTAENVSFFDKYGWLFYVLGFVVLLYVVFNKYLAKKK